MKRVLLLMWKEFIELRQDPRIYPLVLVAPVLQLAILGYAATTDIRNVPVVVADGDRSSTSRDLIQRFDGSPYFSVIDVVGTTREVPPFLDRGRAWLALSIPPAFGARVREGRRVSVQVIADGSDANSATIALGSATSLISAYAAERAAAAPVADDGARAAAAGIDPRVRVWFNPQLESRLFMVPGVLALILLLMTSVFAAMAIVRERENGTLEQLNVTPLNRWELIFGKLLPYALIGLLDALLVVAVAVLWFEVPLRGSLLLLMVLSVVYLLTTLGIGLFVSTIARTQQQAMMTTVFFFMLPMLYLSGFIFPIENMPARLQPVTYLIPLRYYLVIIRGIFLKGVGLETLWREALALAGWGVAMLSLAALRSRKVSR